MEYLLWRMQALALGDLSERARQRAAELANDADLRVSEGERARIPDVYSVSSDDADHPGEQRRASPFSLVDTRRSLRSTADMKQYRKRGHRPRYVS